MEDPPPRGPSREYQMRMLVRRLPLLGVFVVVLASLAYLDHLLQREYRAGAASQASQTDAALESAVDHRAALVHNLQALLTQAPTARDAGDRFRTFAREMIAGAPDMVAVYRLDADGVIRDIFPPSAAPAGWTESSTLRLSDPSNAIARARSRNQTTASGLLTLSTGEPGIVLYDPSVVGGRAVGFVAAAISQRRLVSNALAGQSRSQFAYRITDDAGRVIDAAADYPSQVASLVHREIGMPGGTAWGLDVAIEPFQPVTSRLTMWVTGLLLVALLVLLVIREDARAERLSSHSLKLELLTRNLLDANMRLEERAQQIAEANRAKSRFLANVSHELRTPLNAIMGYNSLALSGLYDDSPTELTAAHERIRTASDHLVTLVDEILDLSKIEVGRMDVELQPVELGSLIDSVISTLEPIAEAKGLRVDVIVERGVPPLMSDPRHLRRILLNVATNAIKFTERGAVTIIARPGRVGNAEAVCLVVEDTGIGIADADVERIFEEFEQVRPEGRGDSAERGTGLGLSVARKLARLLGGDITVESRLAAGSRFTVAIPVRAPAEARVAPRAVPDDMPQPRDGGPAVATRSVALDDRPSAG